MMSTSSHVGISANLLFSAPPRLTRAKPPPRARNFNIEEEGSPTELARGVARMRREPSTRANQHLSPKPGVAGRNGSSAQTASSIFSQYSFAMKRATAPSWSDASPKMPRLKNLTSPSFVFMSGER